MKRFLPHISALTLIIVLVVSSTHVAQAGLFGDGPLFGYTFHDFVVGILAEIVNQLMSLTSWLLALSGTILNMSINITLHIKEFLVGTPAVYTVWKSIRDISGMFMIFTLLFAALKMILAPIGIPGPSVGSLIKTVVVAGILINFSFFVAALGIDVSNIISVQLYNTIAPANSLNYAALETGAKETLKDGGISDIFMKSLKISNFYDAKTASLNPSAEGGTPGTFSASLQIILGGVFGIIVMITAAISFFLAALAFIVRFVILIMLLGFSPIWFAAYAIPDLKTYADLWAKTYKGQLLFMPVYLLLMYFALSVLTTSNLFQTGFATNQVGADSAWWGNFVVLGINAAMVIILLNAPLLAAIKLGAMMPKWADSVGAGNIWKKVGGFAGGMAGRGTARITGASKLDGYLANTKVGNTQFIRDLRSVTTGQINKAKFGSSRSIDDVDKLNKDVTKKSRELSKAAEFSNVLRMIKAGQQLPAGTRPLKEILGSMSEKERLALGKDTLMDEKVIRHLKKSDFEAIKKSEDMSLEDQQAIAKQRKDMFSNAVTYAHASNDTETLALVKDMAKNFDSSDIAGMDESLLTNPKLIEHLSAEHLKKIADGDISAASKATIANTILTWDRDPANGGRKHKAFGYMNKNQNEWV